MTEQEIITGMLMPDLEKRHVTDSTMTYLAYLVETAKSDIAREGITLDLDDVNDCMTVSMYAAYLYRKRALSDNGMPRMLRLRLNERLFAEKTATE